MAIKVEALVVLLCMILHLCGPSGGTQFSHRMPWHVDQGTVDGNAISEDGKVTLAPDEDGNCIGWMSEKFWGTVKWYFANARLIIVLGIDGDGERGEIDSATSYFVNFLHSVTVPTIQQRYHKSNGLPKLRYFERIGVIVVVQKLENLKEFFLRTPTDSVDTTDSNFLFVLLEQARANATEDFIKSLWAQQSIINLMVIMPCPEKYEEDHKEEFGENISQMVGFLDPFVKSEDSWGVMKWLPVNQLNTHPSEEFALWHGNRNFRGYPIKCEMFLKFPTVIEKHEIPEVFQKSYIQKNAKTPHGFGGLDALVLAALAKKLNFTVDLKIYPNIDFGYKLDNGTFTTTLGDVVYKTVDIAFNNRYISSLRAPIEFLYPLMSEKFCFYSPRAKLKPKWLAIFQCFGIDVWLAILIVNIICGLVRYFIKRSQIAIDPGIEKKHPLSRILFETWNVMMSSPSIMLPRRSPERLFLGVCLLVNVILAGTFQGTLVTSLSTPSKYQDINTLKELDESGLIIYTSSPDFFEILGENRTKTYDSLKTKMRLIKRDEYEQIRITATTVFIGRLSDSKLTIEMTYLLPDGSPAFHVVPECPRTYHMSYIVHKGWVFSSVFNKILSYLREAARALKTKKR